MVDKEYDIIIHGATGFTGKLISDYIYHHKDNKSIKWAISGRNLKKLKPISDKYNVTLFEVDSFDIDSLNIITQKAKLIISVVGPYEIYGKKLVESCVNNNCHYLDITGETSFVHYIKNNYTKKAIDSKTILVSCCGFESIPPDIGTYYSTKHLEEEIVDMKCYMKTKGQISGGTWASFLNHFNSKKEKKRVNEKVLKKVKNKVIFYNKEFKKWALLFPDIDKHIVIRSSKSIKGYGQGMGFVKYMLFNSLFKIISLLIPILFISILAKFKFTRKWLESFIPSGSGPSEEKRAKHWFEYILVGKTNNQKITTIVKGGDPGYGETSKFIAEMGLSIILDYDKLNCRKGVLTPAECAGDVMLERLKESGIKFSHKIYKV